MEITIDDFIGLVDNVKPEDWLNNDNIYSIHGFQGFEVSLEKGEGEIRLGLHHRFKRVFSAFYDEGHKNIAEIYSGTLDYGNVHENWEYIMPINKRRVAEDGDSRLKAKFEKIDFLIKELKAEAYKEDEAAIKAVLSKQKAGAKGRAVALKELAMTLDDFLELANKVKPEKWSIIQEADYILEGPYKKVPTHLEGHITEDKHDITLDLRSTLNHPLITFGNHPKVISVTYQGALSCGQVEEGWEYILPIDKRRVAEEGDRRLKAKFDEVQSLTQRYQAETRIKQEKLIKSIVSGQNQKAGK